MSVFVIRSPLPRGFISCDSATERCILTEGCQYQLQYSANSTKVIFSTVTDPSGGDVSLIQI